MSNVSDSVLNTISSQQRHTALVDCVHGWDDGIDADTITSGIHDRFKAVGRHHVVEGGLTFRRSSLKEVALVAKSKYGVELHIVSVLANGEVYVIQGDVLHKHEVDAIVDFMKEHVYH